MMSRVVFAWGLALFAAIAAPLPGPGRSAHAAPVIKQEGQIAKTIISGLFGAKPDKQAPVPSPVPPKPATRGIENAAANKPTNKPVPTPVGPGPIAKPAPAAIDNKNGAFALAATAAEGGISPSDYVTIDKVARAAVARNTRLVVIRVAAASSNPAYNRLMMKATQIKQALTQMPLPPGALIMIEFLSQSPPPPSSSLFTIHIHRAP